MEDVYTTEGKITTITKCPTAETTGFKLPTLSITGRISKLGQHLCILYTAHTDSGPTNEETTFFQWHATFQQLHKEKPLTLLRVCLQ